MEKLVPVSDFQEVVRLLEETDEGLAILRVRGNVPMGGISDIRPHAKRAQIGGVLSAYELMETANTIRASRILRQFIEAVDADEDIEIPHFLAKKEALPILTALEHEINAASMKMDMSSTALQGRSDRSVKACAYKKAVSAKSWKDIPEAEMHRKCFLIPS